MIEFTRNHGHAAFITGEQLAAYEAGVRIYKSQMALADRIGEWLERQGKRGYYDVETRQVVIRNEDGTDTVEPVEWLPMGLISDVHTHDDLARHLEVEFKENWGNSNDC